MPTDPANIPTTRVDSNFRVYTQQGPFTFDTEIPENLASVRDGNATTDLDGRITDDLVRRAESRDSQAILNKVHYYPEEIGNINDSSFAVGYDTPRHALKISILDYYGANIQSIDYKSIMETGQEVWEKLKTEQGRLELGTRLATNESRRVQNRADSLRGGSDILNNINSPNSTPQQREQYRSQIQNWLDSPDGKRFIGAYLSSTNEERTLLAPPPTVTSQTNVNMRLTPDEIKSIIYLYATGDNLNYTYNTSWKAIEMFNGLEGALNALSLAGQGKLDEAASGASEALVGILSNFLSDSDSNRTKDVVKAMTLARAGVVPADNYEFLFEAVKRRSFGVSTVFMPKSQKEIISVGKILSALKYYAHPSRPDMKYFYRVPAVFLLENLTYTPKKGWVENLYLPRYKVAALTNMNVKYDQNGTLITHEEIESLNTQSAAFKSPVKIELSMTFEELNILTREDMTEPNKFFEGDTTKGYY